MSLQISRDAAHAAALAKPTFFLTTCAAAYISGCALKDAMTI